MSSIIVLLGVKEGLVVRESYELIKRRMRDASLFMEVTEEKSKVSINKAIISMAGPGSPTPQKVQPDKTKKKAK